MNAKQIKEIHAELKEAVRITRDDYETCGQAKCYWLAAKANLREFELYHNVGRFAPRKAAGEVAS